MLYEMLTGETPFNGRILCGDERTVLNDPKPARKLNPEISPELQEILIGSWSATRAIAMPRPAECLGSGSTRSSRHRRRGRHPALRGRIFPGGGRYALRGASAAPGGAVRADAAAGAGDKDATS